MKTQNVQVLRFSELGANQPGLSLKYGAALAEAACVCLEDQWHRPGVLLWVIGSRSGAFRLEWEPVAENASRSWADEPFTTEQGAYGVALLIVEPLTRLTVLERSRRGTGFDYWLGSREAQEPLFQNKARLEVSGIRRGGGSTVHERVRQKLRQAGQSEATGLPAVVIVVEFGTPRAEVAEP